MTILKKEVVNRVIFIVYLISFIFKFVHGGFFHQFNHPLFSYPGLNLSYWLFLFLKLPQFFAGNFVAAVIADTLLIGSCIYLIIYPKQYKVAILFTLFNWLNYMSYCLVNVYQPSTYGMLLLSIPAMFNNDIKFTLTFYAVRYWACFLYFEAGITKFLKGGVFNAEQMSTALKISIPLYLVQNNASEFKFQLLNYLINHPNLAQCLYIFAAVLEIVFLIGFFTKRFDWFLLILFVAFHCANQYLLNMIFLNHQVLFACCFIPWEKIQNSDIFKTSRFCT